MRRSYDHMILPVLFVYSEPTDKDVYLKQRDAAPIVVVRPGNTIAVLMNSSIAGFDILVGDQNLSSKEFACTVAAVWRGRLLDRLAVRLASREASLIVDRFRVPDNSIRSVGIIASRTGMSREHFERSWRKHCTPRSITLKRVVDACLVTEVLVLRSAGVSLRESANWCGVNGRTYSRSKRRIERFISGSIVNLTEFLVQFDVAIEKRRRDV